MGITLKKRPLPIVKSPKKPELNFLKKLDEIPDEKRVYVDESGVNTSIQREYGRAPRGEN